jgi:Asp-tRNA(Asn)/Glu-tRNA(Gln) amidotransferase A subunit family amidase
MLDAVLRGPDLRDWHSSNAPAANWPRKAARILSVPRFGAAPVDPEVASQVEAFAQDLSSMGNDVREGEVFFDLEIAARVWHVISRAGVAWLMAENPTYEKLAGAAARAMAEDGRKVSGANYLGALEAVSTLRRRIAELFDGVDLVLTPTAAALPWPAETPYPGRIDSKPAGPRDHAIFTGWVNLAGVPALNIPIGISRSDCRSARISPRPSGRTNSFSPLRARSRTLFLPRHFRNSRRRYMNTRSPGRHFLQIPGPTDVPGRVLRAISEPTIDHRGPDFAGSDVPS